MSDLFREAEDPERLSGTVAREIYRNAAGTFAVVKVETAGGYEATITGPLPPVGPGERLEAEGAWVSDPRHGRQFKANLVHLKPPDSRESIERHFKDVPAADRRKMVCENVARLYGI